ncbi:MAG TPA: hypothetical protein VI837_13785 [Blastocatellia bacterium]|nr:hypothetical protein [Blastocatellia bacterium]
MIKRIIHAFNSAARQLFRRWGALLILLVLYLAMLGAIYQFFVTREATVGQLILSLLLALAAPILFLIIQTMAARYNQGSQRAWTLLGGSLRDFWKLLVIIAPLILIAVLAGYLFGKVETTAPAAAVREAARALPAPPRPVTPKPQPVSWQSVAVTTIEYLLFCLVLPLAAIHLWIRTARDGLKQTFKRSPRILARAFAPQSVAIYAIGFVFFAAVPYFLIVTKTPASSAWLDAGLLVARLLLAALFSLIGWVVTVGALGERGQPSGAASVAQPSEGAGHVPAEA